jgi:hypothetical protein
MEYAASDPLDTSILADRALARWANEGGAGPSASAHDAGSERSRPGTAEPAESECDRLRARVIALENLVAALLGQAPERLLGRVREIAAYISPKPGAMQHPLTVHAAEHMRKLLDRASRFQVAAAVRLPSVRQGARVGDAPRSRQP